MSKFAKPEETREWRNAIRDVVDRLMAGKDWSDHDLIDAIVDAQAAKMREETGEGKPVSYKEARSAVATAILAKRLLPDPKGRKFTQEQIDSLMRHLGTKHVETLRAWDRTLDMLARRVRSANFRAQAEAKK
jgi:hypothetical protein